MGNLFYFPWEVSLIEWLQATLPPALLSIISLFSLFGEELLMIAVLGFLYWCRDKALARRVGYSLLLAVIWCPMIKNAVLRLRPYYASDRIRLLRKPEPDADAFDIAAQGYSLPSGHSVNAAMTFGCVAAELKKKCLWALAIVLPLLVGVSRVTVGAHFPTDVLAGWALALCVSLLVTWLRRVVKNDALFAAILLLITLPGLLYCRSNDYFTGLGLLIGFLAAEPFEKRFVRFENTRVWWRCALRLLGGFVVYFAANSLLKLPFSAAFLESGTMAALLVRAARYAIVVFLDLGVYPLVFRKNT